MTNPDSVGTETKAGGESQPTSASKIAHRAMEFTEAHNRYAVAKKNAYEGRDKGRDSQMAIQILAQRRTAEMMHLFQECMTASTGSAVEKGDAPAQADVTIPQSPQRGEVGEGAMNWLKRIWRCETLEGDEAVGYAAEILCALSRPPVVAKTEAEEALCCAAVEWSANKWDEGSDLRMAARSVAAERALAVKPESEVG